MAKLYDYGRYEELFADKDMEKVVDAINAASEDTEVPYALVGGAAVYLYTHNPPEDSPDLDIMLDADKAGGKQFVTALLTRGFDNLVLDESDADMIARVAYGSITVDVFTSQEDRGFSTETRSMRKLKVKPLIPLIVEKLIRASREDLQMVVDILRARQYDAEALKAAARARECGLLLRKLQRIAHGLESGSYGAAAARLAVRRLAAQETDWPED